MIAVMLPRLSVPNYWWKCCSLAIAEVSIIFSMHLLLAPTRLHFANGEKASNLAGAALIALISALPRLTAPPGGPGAAAGTRSSPELQSPGGVLGVLGVFWGCWLLRSVILGPV